MLLILARWVIISLLMYSSLLGADNNETLINANQKTYETLLQTIKQKKGANDEKALEIALLEKLVSIDANANATVSLPLAPKNVNDYGELFKRYIKDAINKDILSKKVQQIKIKIRSLEEEISNSKKNNASLTTLQLQDAFYTKSVLLYQEKIDIVFKEMKFIAKLLNKSLKSLKFDQKYLLQKTQTYKDYTSKVHDEITKLQIEKERLELLNNAKWRINSVVNLINIKKNIYSKTVLQTITSQFFEFSNALKNKDKKAFAIEKEIAKQISKLDHANSVRLVLIPLLYSMEKYYLGTINTLASSTTQEFKNMLSSFWIIIDEPIFSINHTPISLFKLVIVILIFIIGFYIGGFYKVNIQKIAANSKSINLSTRTILANIGYYIILLISFFIALNVLGINLSSIALVAGALSVGIGFGLQNIVSNFISGLILMFERSIKIGDYIEITDSLRGHVTAIRMRSTTINTNSNIDVIVPNQNFIQNNVINWTMNDEIRRFQIPFDVAYGTKPEKVVEVIKNAIKKSAFGDMINTPTRHTQIVMTSMGGSSVNFELFVWVKGLEILYPKRTISRFLIVIYNALYENNIEIPFPQQDLHIRSIDKDIKLELFLNQDLKHIKEEKK